MNWRLAAPQSAKGDDMPKAGKHTVRIDFGSPNKDGTVKVKFRIKNDAGGNKFDIVATVRVTKGESAADKAKKVRDAIQTQINVSVVIKESF